MRAERLNAQKCETMDVAFDPRYRNVKRSATCANCLHERLQIGIEPSLFAQHCAATTPGKFELVQQLVALGNDLFELRRKVALFGFEPVAFALLLILDQKTGEADQHGEDTQAATDDSDPKAYIVHLRSPDGRLLKMSDRQDAVKCEPFPPDKRRHLC